jgi:cyclopropane-fatty-acyl-phospholipid synthase
MYRVLFHRLLRRIRHGRLAVVDGGARREFGDPAVELSGTIEVVDRSFYRDVALAGEIGLGRSYVAGKWRSPDLENVCLILNLNVERFLSAVRGGTIFRFGSRLVERFAQRALARRKASTPANSRRGMSIAYDVGERFFRLMLGESMLYSCAVFPTPEDDLESAQRHKIDLIIGKLAVEPGHRVLDIGCGWGTLLGEIRSRYGCDVHGISLARRQIDYCREHYRGGRFDYVDYRELEGESVYDRIVSVGMIEHVGAEYLETFVRIVAHLLKPGGRAVLHTMIEGDALDLPTGSHVASYAASTIMPTSYIPSAGELRRAINRCAGLYPVHEERFGQHYGQTMREWRRNVLAQGDAIAKLHSEEHVRIYDYIWAMSSGCFTSSNFDLQQLVVERGTIDNGIRAYDPRAERSRRSR